MVLSYDVGSLPLRVGESVIREGAKRSQTLLPLVGTPGEATDIFEDEVVKGFIDKLDAGIDIPNFPQFRDMNGMYFDLIRGIEEESGGYSTHGIPSARSGASVPEVDVIKRNISKIIDLTGVNRVRLKICVTGPYTLASFFHLKNPTLFEDLGEALAGILSRSIFSSRRGAVAMVCLDEPVLGFLNDPLLDYGSEGREAMIKSWDHILGVAASKGVETSMHLHDTSDDLFWEVEHLDLVESHVDDPLYTLEKTERRLDETDKRLKASISITLFDTLIEARLKAQGFQGEIQQGIGDTWTDIRHNRVDPLTFVEEADLMVKRLQQIVERFGSERVPYAGPECGMGGWPRYGDAIEGLRRVSEAVQQFSIG
ncbi:MAG: hypothetical protein PVJ38_04210 [Candidatus Bathyarchaeota archaeon]|jgi:5-methyltetrahydropteroyltriglutamate--homocysteine methyltransferase